jgi:soluble lytic murein transglycosylase-like protein
VARGRGLLLGAWAGALCVATLLALLPGALICGAETAWREGASQMRARRDAWDDARRTYRSARWGGTLQEIAATFDRAARAESTYLAELEAWTKSGAIHLAGRPDPAFESMLRAGALDLMESGRLQAAELLLRGPLRFDSSLAPIQARAVGLLGAPDSGLALLGWPPDRRAATLPRSASDPTGRFSGPQADASYLVAAELSDSLDLPRARRAALWRLQGHPRAAVRSYARMALARSLIASGEPRLAGAVLTSAPAMSPDEEALLVDIRADLLASVGDTLGAAELLVDAVRAGKGSLAARYPLAKRAAEELRGARVDSLDEARWLELARLLGTMGEGGLGIALLDARRAPLHAPNADFMRAELRATLLARVKRHDEAVLAYRRLLVRKDLPADVRARLALGLARSQRALGNFASMDSAFVKAVALDPRGPNGAQAAWERAREWEDRRSPVEAAAIFAWARPHVDDPAIAQPLAAHAGIAWLRAGKPDSAVAAITDSVGTVPRYWRARARLAAGDTAGAYALLATIAGGEPWTYEGIRARENLAQAGVPLAAAVAPADSDTTAEAALRTTPERELDPPLQARVLGSAGAVPLLMDLLRECAKTGEPAQARGCTDELEERGVFRVGRPGLLPQARLEYPPAYPTAVLHAADQESLAAALLWAIMRQESIYQRAARSRAGAIGLLQLMPSTASRLNGSPVTEGSLTDPDLNVRLGAAYLRGLLREFKDPRAAMAAYNAGEDAVRRWVHDRPVVDDVWVEMIPYRETRDYVKQVYSIWRRYEALYGSGSAGRP